MRQQECLVVASYLPPLGTVGGSIRTVKFLQYADPKKWKFTVVTQDPEHPVVQLPVQSASLLRSIPEGTVFIRAKSLLRIPRKLQKKVAAAPSGIPTEPGRPVSVTRQLVVFLKQRLFIPDEDILWAFSSLPRVLWATRRMHPDVVFASGPPYSVLVLGYLLSLWFRSPLVVDMKDDWRENCLRTNKGAIVTGLEMFLERVILRRARQVLVPTAQGHAALVKRFGENMARSVQCIPNGFDGDEFRRSRARPRQKPDRFTVVCASGVLRPDYRDASVFLRAYAQLALSSEGRTQLQFLGTEISEQYGGLVEHLGLRDHVVSRMGLTREEYIDALFGAHCLLIIQLDGAGSSIAGTLYEYAAVPDVPVVLVGGKGATRDFLADHDLGYAFEANDLEGISECLRSLFHEWVRGMPTQKKKRFEADAFDRVKLATRFEEALGRAAESARPVGTGEPR